MTQRHSLRQGRWIVMGGVLAALAVALPSHAQPVAVPEPASADPAALDRAKRDADKVFKWILIHADKPRKNNEAKAAEVKPAAPAPAPARTAAAPAAPRKSDDTGIVERVTPLPVAAAPRPGQRASAPSEAMAAAPAPTDVSQARGTPASAAEANQPTVLAMAAPRATAPSLPVPPAELDEDEDQPLELVKQVEPDFPPSVMRKLTRGSVHVRFEVLPDGSVGQMNVVKTTSNRLNTAALDALAKWRFKPLRKAQTGVVELAFNLE